MRPDPTVWRRLDVETPEALQAFIEAAVVEAIQAFRAAVVDDDDLAACVGACDLDAVEQQIAAVARARAQQAIEQALLRCVQ